MLCFVSLERRWRSKERMRYCSRARSVCRIDSVRFRFGLFTAVELELGIKPGSAGDAATSSIVSIYTPTYTLSATNSNSNFHSPKPVNSFKYRVN